MPATYEPIATTTLGSAAASVTFSSISGSYTDLVLVVNGTWTGSGNSSFGFTVNNDTASNYSITGLYGDGSSAASYKTTNQPQATNGQINPSNNGTTIFQFMNYSNSTTYKSILSRSGIASNITLTGIALWRNTSAINLITLGYFDTAGNFATGSTFTLYGIAAA